MRLLEPKSNIVSKGIHPTRSDRQSALSELRAFASTEPDLQSLLEEAARLICKGLGTELCKVLRLSRDHKSFLLFSGCGWKRGLVGKAVTDAGKDFQAGYTIRSKKTVIVSDIQHDDRFHSPPLLTDHNVISGISTPLVGELGPWGVLGAHWTRKRRFSQSEIDFFETVADIISTAIQRDIRAKTYAEANQTLQLALQMAEVGTWTVDVNRRTATRDAILNKIHGFEPVDSTQSLDEYWALVHPDDRQRVIDRTFETIKNGKYSELEFRIVRPDGAIRWLHGRGKMVADGYLAGAVLDVTDRKHDEADMTRLASIVDSSQDAIIGETLEGIITSWNRGAEKMFGYSAQEMVGKSVTLLFAPENSHELDPIFAKVKNHQPVEPFETVRLRKDGTPINVSSAISPIYDTAGNITGVSAIIRDITQRRQAEVALQESEARLRLALEAGKLGTWEWHIANGTVVWSPNLKDLHGMPDDAPTGSFEDFKKGIHPDDKQMVLKEIEQALASRNGFHVEYRLVNGKWVEGRGNVIVDATGTPIKMAGVCADITKRKEAEAALRESEERFRHMADAAPAMVWLSGEDRRSYYFNKAWLNFRGRTLEEELGHGWTEGVHPHDLDKCLGYYQDAYCQRKPFDLRYRLKRHDGEYRSVFCSGIPRFDPEGRFLGYVGSAVDITEIQRAEHALREEAALRASEARFRELADAMPHIVWECQPDGFFDYFNKRWHEYTGVAANTGSHEIWKSIYHPDDWEKAVAQFHHILSHAVAGDGEFRFKHHQSGTYRWHLARVLPIRNEAGEVIRFIGTATDIHDQKKTQHDLAEAKEELRKHAAELESSVQARTGELQESLKTTETLLYTIAHDLRSPLRAMQGMAIAVLDDYAFRLDDDGREYLNRIHHAAKRMDQLISDLLAYGRLGHVDMPLVQLDIDTEIKNAVSDLEHDIKQSNAEVIVETSPATVRANPTALQQVFTNLLSNAIKFVPPERKPQVTITSEEKAATVRVSVADNGIGIDPAHRTKIFEVFQRLHTNDVYPGTGIGLAIVAKAVQRMGGTVGVESAEGSGTCFWIELPKARPEST